MKRYLLVLGCFLGFATSLFAQTVDATVCEILSNPQSFDGKIVRIKGTVIAGFEEFAIKDSTCKQALNAIWLSYPDGAKGKAGPAALVQMQLAKNSPGTAVTPTRAAVQLEKNKDFKEFDSLLSTPYRGNGMCMACMKYTVSATLVGRLDGTKTTGVVRDGKGMAVSVSGFGNMNLYAARLVLQSVSDVTKQEMDYSKAAAVAAKDPWEPGGSIEDPNALVLKEVKAFPAETPAAKELQKALDAFGKPGEKNGVEVSFALANDVSKQDLAKGRDDSPDGLLFNCTFDRVRLKGDEVTKAVVHAGTHIADFREGHADYTPFQSETMAWRAVVLSAVATHQKTLTLPGGYIAWNSDWTGSDRGKNADQGITQFLTEWAGFQK
jgi:hypothetical protein